MSSVAVCQYVSGKCAIEILNTLNSVKKMLKQHIIQNFIPINVTKQLAEKPIEGLYEECDKFYLGRNYTYRKCVEYLDKWMKPTQDFSGFTRIPFSQPLNWNNAEPSV
jgi:hypothetical protein